MDNRLLQFAMKNVAKKHPERMNYHVINQEYDKGARFYE
ncbi:hypothetical protein JCM19237_6542 [Photobacterium aphoticum]|uniref:Uncharacterized protein n=1 Tax=Photobacterium aphoticum TaxID=754436 RepID=A0A090QN31_9GAMM|nr:hypothetical protein JCM19237_6542 [Photobacterium aphoticum]